MRDPDLILLHAPSVYDFRRLPILYGPVSDLVPSTPVFEMYPIGFTTIAEYLERHGLQTRIVNLAVRMLEDAKFDVEGHLKKLNTAIFGIDLHWLPHAHGSIEVAKIVKRLHPGKPVLFGGFSSTYYHQELILYPAVDFILRGDTTEDPTRQLVQYVVSGGAVRPAEGSADYRALEKIPNLVWKDSTGGVHVNPISYQPDNLDYQLLDYTHVMKAVVRYRDLASYMPFRSWLRYPITAALTVHGCRFNCTTCGGSAYVFRNIHNRTKPVYRSPERLAQDIFRIGEYAHAPIMILGDIRQGGDEYANRFLDAVAGYKKPVLIEMFDAAPRAFFQKLRRSLPNFTVEISMESADEGVRRAFGRPYSNAEIERSIADALEAGAQRLDLFYMVGLKEQTYQKVMDTVDYCRMLLERHTSPTDKRLIPFISPMAPFLDPGSRAFEEPEKHGYRLFARTLEEHRQLLLGASWKYILNYETAWMNRDEIVASTYEAARELNLLKGEFGVIPAAKAEATDCRIARAEELIGEIDRIMALPDAHDRQQKLLELKAHVDDSNLSTVCDKGELEVAADGARINMMQAAGVLLRQWWQEVTGSAGED